MSLTYIVVYAIYFSRFNDTHEILKYIVIALVKICYVRYYTLSRTTPHLHASPHTSMHHHTPPRITTHHHSAPIIYIYTSPYVTGHHHTPPNNTTHLHASPHTTTQYQSYIYIYTSPYITRHHHTPPNNTTHHHATTNATNNDCVSYNVYPLAATDFHHQYLCPF